jgi:hypothetical protein
MALRCSRDREPFWPVGNPRIPHLRYAGQRVATSGSFKRRLLVSATLSGCTVPFAPAVRTDLIPSGMAGMGMEASAPYGYGAGASSPRP